MMALKQALGDRLFMRVKAVDPVQCRKLTGMLLDLDVQELQWLLKPENGTALLGRIREARDVLYEHLAMQQWKGVNV